MAQEDEHWIGRSSSCHTKIESHFTATSRRHCYLSVRTRGVEIREESAQHGVYIYADGEEWERVSHKILAKGDEILLGTLAEKCSLGDSIEVDDLVLEEAKPSAIISTISEPFSSINLA
jgi:predicted component of type VI protein secretion system